MVRTNAVHLPKALRSPSSVAPGVNADRIRRRYSKREWESLEAGEIVSGATREADGQHAHAAGMMAYLARDLWPILVDFEARPAFLPGAQDIRIVKVDGNRVWLAEHVKVLFVNVRYQVVNTLDPRAGSVSWTLDDTVANDIAATAGAWELVPVAGRTLVQYRNVLDTGRPVPGAIERLLLERSLPQMIGGLRGEAKRRLG